MSKIFWAQAEIGPDGEGRLSLGSDYNRARFADFLRIHPGTRMRIDPYTPESSKQRKFFEGAIVPFVTFFQENLDYNDTDDLARVRDWLKIEFNGQFITLGGKSVKVPKSTKGELNRGFLERILDWCGEQGYPIEFLNTADYKDWNDRIRPTEGPPHYIDYLVSVGKLRPMRGGDNQG